MIFNACYELSARSLPEEKKYFNHLKISFEIPHRPERPFPHHHKHQKKKNTPLAHDNPSESGLQSLCQWHLQFKTASQERERAMEGVNQIRPSCKPLWTVCNYYT